MTLAPAHPAPAPARVALPPDPALARVQVGIDAAVVADHHVTIRATLSDGQVQLSRFHVPPTIAGLSRLGERLSVFPGVVAVAEPTSMTWLALSIAMRRSGGDLSLLGARHAARRICTPAFANWR